MNKTTEEEINEFDDIQDSNNTDKQKIDPVLNNRFEKRAELIYHIFGKTEEGEELLKIWIEDKLINESPFELGNQHDMHSMGIIHGEQNFIKRISRFIKLKTGG